MAKKSKSKSKGEFPSYEPTKYEAPQRSVLQEGREGLQVMREAYPAILELNQRYGADFARNEADVGAARSAAEQAAITAQAPGFRKAILDSSPEIAKANVAIQSSLGELGPSAVEGELSTQALRDLKLGGELSPEDIRGAQQAARAAWSARGLATSSPAAIAEVLNRQSFAEARLDKRRAFASGVDQLRTQRKASDAATANNLFNTSASFWDPQNRIFGRGGSAVSGQVTGPGSFTPFLQAAGNVGQGNQQAALATNALNQQGEQFAQERADTNWYTLFNAGQTNANAAANRSASTKNAAIGVGTGILAMAALAFI